MHFCKNGDFLDAVYVWILLEVCNKLTQSSQFQLRKYSPWTDTFFGSLQETKNNMDF